MLGFSRMQPVVSEEDRVTDNQEFFDERQGAAVIKHGILRRYLPVFAAKTGSTSVGGRVVYLDGYAGAGVYDSGEPGSPILAVETAGRLAGTRALECFMIERDRTTYQKLCTNLVGAAVPPTIRKGSVHEGLDEFLAMAGPSPVFAFLDPFGLPPAMEDIAKLMQRVPATEVLVGLQLAGIRRNAGKLKPTTSTHAPYLKARVRILEIVDESMGGDWWRTIAQDDPENYWVDEIVAGYTDRLSAACGKPGWWRLPVRKRLDGPTVYYLILLTRHRDGLWFFHESVSGAHGDFLEFTQRGKDPSMFEVPEYRNRELVDRIKANIATLLPGPFTTRDKLAEVFGDTLGAAREKHVRQAVVELHAEGKVEWDGVTRAARHDAKLPDHRIAAP
jgi:three-Cys-motif partner protein